MELKESWDQTKMSKANEHNKIQWVSQVSVIGEQRYRLCQSPELILVELSWPLNLDRIKHQHDSTILYQLFSYSQISHTAVDNRIKSVDSETKSDMRVINNICIAQFILRI